MGLEPKADVLNKTEAAIAAKEIRNMKKLRTRRRTDIRSLLQPVQSFHPILSKL